MVEYAGILPTRLAQSGLARTYIAAGRIPYGAAVIRSAEGTIVTATGADDETILGWAMDDDRAHLYDGFYEQYEPVPVVGEGELRALVAFISDADMIAGDFLELGQFSSAQAGVCGVLAEAGNAAGETRTDTSIAKAMEDGDFGSNFYKNVDDVAAGAMTVTMHVAGDVATMGLSVGDFILLANIDGAVQVNRVAGISSETLTVEVPSIALDQSDGDLCYRLWQKIVKVLA